MYLVVPVTSLSTDGRNQLGAVVPVAAIVSVFPAGTNRCSRGTTTAQGSRSVVVLVSRRRIGAVIISIRVVVCESFLLC